MSIPAQNRLTWVAIVAVPVFFAAIAGVQGGIDARTRSAQIEQDELTFRSPTLIKRMSLGYEPLMADIYWTRTVQYYGARVGVPDEKFALLWPLLDITTTLDPKLIPAYRFGTIFLSEGSPIGPGRTDLAVELAKRGVAANPDEWRLRADLGFLYYWRLKDYPKAAETYFAASNIPHAPPWLKLMAARISDKGGSVETSRMMWSELYESSTNQKMREIARDKLRGLRAQDDIAHLEPLVEDYRKRFGRYPASMAELREAGMLPGIAVDSDGLPYVIGAGGKVELNPRSTVKLD
jgi:hypothetical protein